VLADLQSNPDATAAVTYCTGKRLYTGSEPRSAQHCP